MENNLAHKIKELRLKNKMTLEEVANIVGVGKSTVRKWETGMIANMKRDKISLLAKALGTTPAYLMGWKEDNETPPATLTEGEQKWLEFYHKVSEETRRTLMTSFAEFDELTPEQQQLVLDLIRVALKNRR